MGDGVENQGRAGKDIGKGVVSGENPASVWSSGELRSIHCTKDDFTQSLPPTPLHQFVFGHRLRLSPHLTQGTDGTSPYSYPPLWVCLTRAAPICHVQPFRGKLRLRAVCSQYSHQLGDVSQNWGGFVRLELQRNIEEWEIRGIVV